MSRRFFPVSEPKEGSRFANLSERLNAPLPGEPLYGKNSYDAPLGGTSKRLEAFRKSNADTSPVASPKASTAPKPTVAQPKVTPPTPAQAAQAAATAAKARHNAVMASATVRGREKQAAALLMASCKAGSKFASADAIIAELERAPTDAQLSAVDRHMKSVAAQKVWDRVNAKRNEQMIAANPALRSRIENQTAPLPTGNTAAARWDRAWAKVAAERGRPLPQSAAAQTVTAKESVWDKAWAKMERAKP